MANGALGDEAKSKLEVDDLWNPELLDKFETAKQARSDVKARPWAMKV